MQSVPPPPFPPNIPRSSAQFGHRGGSSTASWEFTAAVWVPGYAASSLWGWNNRDRYWLNLWKDGTDDGETSPFGFAQSFPSASAVVYAIVRHVGVDPLTVTRALGLHPTAHVYKTPRDYSAYVLDGAALALDWILGRTTMTPSTHYTWPAQCQPSIELIVAEWAYNEGKLLSRNGDRFTAGIDEVLADQFHWTPTRRT